MQPIFAAYLAISIATAAVQPAAEAKPVPDLDGSWIVVVTYGATFAWAETLCSIKGEAVELSGFGSLLGRLLAELRYDREMLGIDGRPRGPIPARITVDRSKTPNTITLHLKPAPDPLGRGDAPENRTTFAASRVGNEIVCRAPELFETQLGPGWELRFVRPAKPAAAKAALEPFQGDWKPLARRGIRLWGDQSTYLLKEPEKHSLTVAGDTATCRLPPEHDRPEKVVFRLAVDASGRIHPLGHFCHSGSDDFTLLTVGDLLGGVVFEAPARALAGSARQKLVEGLLKQLADRDRVKRIEAADKLAEMTPLAPGAAEALFRCVFTDPDADVRKAAEKAVRKFGPRR